MVAHWRKRKNSEIQKNKIKVWGAEVIGADRKPLDFCPQFMGKSDRDFLILSDHPNKTVKTYDAFMAIKESLTFAYRLRRCLYILGKDGR